MADRMLRASLERVANLRDFLEAARPDLVAGFDFSGVQLLPREFFSADWREREATSSSRFPTGSPIKQSRPRWEC